MPDSGPYTQRELSLLSPFGGPEFAEQAVRSIRSADAATYNDCRALFLDPKYCDVIGEVRRAKIHEALVGLAEKRGLRYSFEKPERQRYNNLLIQAGGSLLTVARMYGRHRLSLPSKFRCDFAQTRLDLFGETDSSYIIPDKLFKTLVLAYGVGIVRGRPMVTGIELQEIGLSPRDVTLRIDLASKIDAQFIGEREAVFDDFDIKIKENRGKRYA